jgi:hypothetical protein
MRRKRAGPVNAPALPSLLLFLLLLSLLLFLLLPLLPLLKSPRAVFSRGIAQLLLSLLTPARNVVGAHLRA